MVNMMSVFIVVGLWVVILSGSQADDFTCELSKEVDNGPALPTILSDSDSYQAHLEVTVLDKNYTMAVDEYLDYEGNRALLVIYMQGMKTNVIFSYDTNEVFTTLDKNGELSCQSQNISDSKYNFIFGSSQLFDYDDPDKRHIFGTAAALRFGTNASYMGTGEVRGIAANIWSACITWPNLKGNMQVTYYFSVLNWNVSSPLAQSLLQIEIEGLSTVSVSGTTASQPRYFHHLYEFINFLPYLDEDPSVFLTPLGVVCNDRKHTRPLPQFPESFSYRAEVLDPINSQVTHYAVMYNRKAKLIKLRSHSQEPSESYETTVPKTEIHDFNTGIRYDLDDDGGCSVNPTDPDAWDSQEDKPRLKFNGSLVVEMKSAENLFMINKNFTFTGQRFVRGMLCDVFSYEDPSFIIQGAATEVIFEHHFLAENWNDLPLNSLLSDVKDYPVQLIMIAPKVSWKRIYNFYEFVSDAPPIDAFDISSCFKPSLKAAFRLTFPGIYDPKIEKEWIEKLHISLAKTMQVFPTRITGITITYDNYNIYVDAVLLDTISSVQFEHLADPVLEHSDAKVYKNVKSEGECATLCVHNPDFVCEGFQLCPDDGFVCRILKTHITTTKVLSNATACDDYSRTVNVPVVKELSLVEAYSLLTQAVSNKQLELQIENSEGFTPDPYEAIYVELKSGKAVQSKQMPPMPSQGSLRLEIIFPTRLSAIETFVWYDSDLGVSRYDTRDPEDNQPFQITRIHDFNTGVSYEINQVTLECSVVPLTNDNLYDVKSSPISTNGSFTVTMRSPLEAMFMDYPYEYVGQSTVRGIPCDVYEANRRDYNSIFKYYFQTDEFEYISPISTDITRSQPVQLIIEGLDGSAPLTYNFYDFSDQRHTTNYFDTSACFGPDEKKSFMVIFKDQPYQPILDQTSATFLDLAVASLATQTFTSLIRFQGASVSYDDDDVYLTITALGKVKPITLFTPVKRVDPNLMDVSSYAQNPDDCAASCVYETDTICNSFDWCPDKTSPSCVVGAKHEESENNDVMNLGRCLHFSRSENATFPAPSVQRIYQIVTDYVYAGDFNITINVPDGTTQTYTATDIRDDILLPEDPDSTSGSFLRKFAVSPKVKMNSSLISVTHQMVSVTDCAVLCIQEILFRCEAFDYMFTVGMCRLSNFYPDAPSAPSPALIRNDYYSTYTRLYSDEYRQHSGLVLKGTPDKSLPDVKSMEVCARACTDNTDFVCESFQLCSNTNSCDLFKTHILQAEQTDLTKSLDCTHYSRNHMFDYIKRDRKAIQGYDLSVAEVEDIGDCAHMCSSSNYFPFCGSFQVCVQGRGGLICNFLSVDPTVSKDITIQDNQTCTLYTKANAVPVLNPTVNTETSKRTMPQPSSTDFTNKRKDCKCPQAFTDDPSKTDTNPPNPSSTDSTNNGKGCFGGSSGDSTDETGTRVGIAFGSLFLGIAVGALVLFFIMHFRQKQTDTEDAHMLKTWNN